MWDPTAYQYCARRLLWGSEKETHARPREAKAAATTLLKALNRSHSRECTIGFPDNQGSLPEPTPGALDPAQERQADLFS